MWPTSSSTYVGINRDSETALQSIGQYIEDYIDLVENVPNDIVRGITQFHEKNHVYHHLLDRLEKSMDRAINASDEEKRKKAVDWIQKYLIDIQVLADEKLNVGQSIFEQLELKARQLDHDIRAINIGSGGNNLFSPIKSRNNDRASYATSQFARGQNNNSHSHNGNNHSAVTNGNNLVSEESQDSSVSPDQENEGKDNHDTPSRGRGAKKRQREEEDEEEKDVETPVKDSKRTRRIKSSKHHDKHSHNDREEKEVSTREESSNSRGKGGKGRGGLKSGNSSGKNGSNQDHHHSSSGKGSSRRGHRDSSPPSVYDEPSPLDPDEPTYCVCQQISFGEMIGCDNSRCPIEWFHFSCVGLTTKPKGKWYCPSCRGERSNIQRK